MEGWAFLLKAVTAAAFVAVAVAAAARWREQRYLGTGWAATAFVSLAAVSIHGIATAGRERDLWEQTIIASLVILFPYFIFRFASAFSPASRGAGWGALASTVGLLAATTAMSSFAASNLSATTAYVGALVLHWGAWSGIAAVKLWRLGKDAPAVPRRRMRLLSIATAGLVVALSVAVSVPAGRSGIRSLVDGLTLATAIAFYLGFAPPRSLRLLWREDEQDRLRVTIETLVSSPTVETLVSDFLPQAAQLVGADSLALLDPENDEIASFGATRGDRAERTFVVDLPRGAHLRVTVGRTAPHFGEDELQILRSVGSLAVMSIDRTRLYEKELATRVFAESVNASLQNRIEERQAAEEEAHQARLEAERANKAKSEFLSRMSHELRTPLNSIIGFSQLLETEIADPDQLESLGYIRKGGRHLLDLINEVLDISRIEADRLTMSIEAVQLSDVVTEAAELIMPMAAERSIVLTIDPSQADLCVKADRQRLKQVVLNLLSNAVKYNRPEGEVRIGWHTEDGRARVAVSDTGMGIPRDSLDRLFQPFERLGAEGSDIEGTGLGLALSKRLVEMMDGTLSATSDDRGSTFLLTLEVETISIAADHIELEEQPTTTEAEDEITVLYIEDNLANLTLVEHVLKQRPWVKLMTAMQGSIGLQLAADHSPDVILLDLHLPDIPGNEVLHRLKADPGTSSTPTVIISADATPGQARRFIEAGAADYITKPLDIHRFLEVLDRLSATGVGEDPVRETAATG